MTKLQDIADYLGVAPSTVSKGLNGANDISEDLRQQIIETAVEMGYVTKKMRKEKHRKLAILFENMPYESKGDAGYAFALGFKQLAQKSNWTVETMSITPEMQSERKFDAFMLRHGLSGAFLVGFGADDIWLAQLRSSRTPAVIFGPVVSGPRVASISIDPGSMFGELLANLTAQGHAQIAYFSGQKNHPDHDVLREAFQRACQKAGLNPSQCPVASDVTHPSCAEDYVNTYIDRGVTAIICHDDSIAEGIYAECELLGYKIPDDLSVIGYGDCALCTSISPMLTSIRMDASIIGKSAYNTLEGLLAHLPVAQVLLRPSIIIRQSTGISKNA